MDISIFKVSVADSALDKLRSRLSSASFPNELENARWDMGAPLADVQRLLRYWKDGFDWRQSERDINTMPQFQTSIEINGFETLDIHFVHQQSIVPGAIPLLFCHGWPGSFLEVKKLLPLLTAGNHGLENVAFHVVAPSLPNFGFSAGVKKRGFGLRQYAETCHKLMQKLGYFEYVTQGGDWGFHITRMMGLLYPNQCKVSHLNVAEASAPSFSNHPILAFEHLLTPYSPHERAGLERTAHHRKTGMGYDILQQTKPQTIAYALADSPVALLAWISEKLHEWTDDYPWTDDEILTWVSIYWHSTAGPAASLRIYYESNHPGTDGLPYDRALSYIPHVKYGIAHFPKDLTVLPNTWAATLGDVILQTRNPHGGHFAAVEHPEIIPPKRRPPPPTTPSLPATKPSRPSALAKAHHISARTEAEIREAFSLFAVPSPSAKPSATATSSSSVARSSLPSSSLRRALLALACAPTSAAELASLLEAADPIASGVVGYENFVAVAALKLQARGAEVRRGEVREAWGLFVGGEDKGGGRGGFGEDKDEEEEGEGEERRITIADLRRVARELKEEVSEQVLADMILEANGGRGVKRGVGVREFEGVMRRAGVFG
ncbi:hypothetical protein MMC17_004345 [Xylographa soralifera]|nr:hypothetical protein [Xylographa soralifera]